MKFRKVIFWIHLACGVAAGLVILMMSVTGVLLTYERQITSWFDEPDYASPAPPATRLPVTLLLESAMEYAPDIKPAAVTLSSDPTAPVTVQLNRTRNLYLNPYTGEILNEGARGIRSFFQAVTGWHRWFNLEGEARGTARAVTGACNLIFLFLVMSGMYLWRPFIRGVLFFNPRATTGRARDYNWHHVFGIWSSIPLLIVIATAVVFSYPWANNLVFRSVGEEPIRRGMHGPGPERETRGRDARNSNPTGNEETGTSLSLDELFQRAAVHLDNWKTITIQDPAGTVDNINFLIDQGTGGQPQKRHQLTLGRGSGEVIKWEPFNSLSPGRRMRVLIRFLHTGEALGIPGQTIAGLVSLTSLIMVWTGLALAWRRLIVPLLKKY